jgi:hypothetical protein
MSAISQFASGFRLFTGESLNSLVNVINNMTGFGTPQPITATTITTSGASLSAPTTVAAAGATQGNATAIPVTANNIVVTVTASTEGVKLPSVSVGARYTILPSTTVGCKVYAGVAGQSIGTGTTATTAVSVALNKATQFIGVSATKWRVLASA